MSMYTSSIGVQIRKREKGRERECDCIRKKRPDAWEPPVFYNEKVKT